MTDDETPRPCARCGAVVPGGTTGCFALFYEIEAKEYTGPAYGAVNLLTVNAHALQHPEDHGVKNNAFHLIRLCWLLEYGGAPRIGQGPRWLQKRLDGNVNVPVLEPPVRRGEVTIADVYGPSSPEEYAERVRHWGWSVWEAWNAYHKWTQEQVRER